MVIKLLYSITFFFLAFTTTAQDDFLVHHVQGRVFFLGDNTSVIRGAVIGKKMVLNIKANSRCMLIEKSGKSLNVIKPGTYDFKKLHAMLKGAGKENIPDEFLAYVYKNYTKTKPVDRLGAAPVVVRDYLKMVTPYDSGIITGNKIIFKWRKPAKLISMRLVIIGDDERIILDSTFRHAVTYEAGINRLIMSETGTYKWKVFEAGTEQVAMKCFSFIIARPGDRKKINNQQRLISSMNISTSLKLQLQKDLFAYWKDRYRAREE